MSPSGAELLREIKSRIEEIDPSKVHELLDEGVAIIDVRETEEYGAGHLPGAKHVPKSYLESRIEGVVPIATRTSCSIASRATVRPGLRARSKRISATPTSPR